MRRACSVSWISSRRRPALRPDSCRFRSFAGPRIAVFFLTLFLGLAGCGAAADEASIRADEFITERSLLAERAGRLTVARASSARFTPLQNHRIGWPVAQPLWLRLRLSPGTAPAHLILEIAGHSREPRVYQSMPGRKATALSPAKVATGWPAFELYRSATEPTTVFLRLEDGLPPLRIHSHEQFVNTRQTRATRAGLNAGAVLVLLLSVLVAWWLRRDSALLFLAGFQFCFALALWAWEGELSAAFAGANRLFGTGELAGPVFFLLLIGPALILLGEFWISRGLPPRATRVLAAICLAPFILFSLDPGLGLGLSCVLFLGTGLVTLGAGLSRLRNESDQAIHFILASLPLLYLVFQPGLAILAGLNGDTSAWFARLVPDASCAPVLILPVAILAFRAERRRARERVDARLTLTGRTGELIRERLRIEAAERGGEQLRRMVSHDLRSPLSAIKTNLPFLRRDPPLPVADQRQLVRDIEDTVATLIELSEHILASDQEGDVPGLFEPEWCPARALVADAFRRLETQAGQRGVQLTNAIDDEYEVLVDPNLSVRLLTQLVTNALEQSRAGKQIEAMADVTGSVLRITVADQGPGIPPGLARVLLDPGAARPPLGDEKPNAGLGLLICREIAESHGGRLSITGNARGCQVHLDLPRFRSRAAAPEKGDRPLVLVIDDYEAFRGQLRYLFERIGVNVAEAVDGPQALRMLAGLRPDLIISDMFMPEIAGTSLIPRLRTEGYRGPIWIISGDPNANREARAAGAERFFPKPLDLARFQATILDEFPGQTDDDPGPGQAPETDSFPPPV